jgi:hypothetical protein
VNELRSTISAADITGTNYHWVCCINTRYYCYYSCFCYYSTCTTTTPVAAAVAGAATTTPPCKLITPTTYIMRTKSTAATPAAAAAAGRLLLRVHVPVLGLALLLRRPAVLLEPQPTTTLAAPRSLSWSATVVVLLIAPPAVRSLGPAMKGPLLMKRPAMKRPAMKRPASEAAATGRAVKIEKTDMAQASMLVTTPLLNVTTPPGEDPRVCEVCMHCCRGEMLPFGRCWFCGANPSWHHGRCCPARHVPNDRSSEHWGARSGECGVLASTACPAAASMVCREHVVSCCGEHGVS